MPAEPKRPAMVRDGGPAGVEPSADQLQQEQQHLQQQQQQYQQLREQYKQLQQQQQLQYQQQLLAHQKQQQQQATGDKMPAGSVTPGSQPDTNAVNSQGQC